MKEAIRIAVRPGDITDPRGDADSVRTRPVEACAEPVLWHSDLLQADACRVLRIIGDDRVRVCVSERSGQV